MADAILNFIICIMGQDAVDLLHTDAERFSWQIGNNLFRKLLSWILYLGD